MSTLPFPKNRSYDLACLGRLAVDLYCEQFGAPLEGARSMAMYLGGSSANVAFGVARLGLRSAMISRVGDEQMGRFLLGALTREGCDVSQVQVDPRRLSALALLGMKDRDTFPLLFVRENCADMAIEAADISEAFIAQCSALAITGTHLSTDATRAAVAAALRYAGSHGVVRVLDIDYRPVLWGLTRPGDGENRYVADASVSARLQETLGSFELIVGTEEEFMIAGGVAGDLLSSLRRVRAVTSAVLVLKRGPLGCCLIEGAVPDDLGALSMYAAEYVRVRNVLGAGDAFLSGLLSSLLRGEDWAQAARVANACGSIVVSRHACSAAMPTSAELLHWFASPHHLDVDGDAELAHLHRVSVKRPLWEQLNVMAFDHRSQFLDLAREAGADEARIPMLKHLLLSAVAQVETRCALQGRIGVLIDGGDYGADALALATGRGWWVGRPVELPGSRPLRFDDSATIGSALVGWPAEQVVKCLVHYHPDDAVELRLEQEDRLLELWEATRAAGNELLLEVIPPRELCSPGTEDVAVLRTVQRLYNLGIRPEWWKLAPMRAAGWQALGHLLAERDPYCRGAVILGLNQSLAELAASFTDAQDPVVKGFMVGRTLWARESLRWLRGEIDDTALAAAVAANFVTLVEAWAARRSAASAALRAGALSPEPDRQTRSPR